MALKGYEVAVTADESGSEWTGETNAFLSNNTYATYNNTTQAFLRVKEWDIVLPLNAIVRGIEVSIEGNGDGGTVAERTIEVSLTKDGAALAGVAKTLALNLTTDTVQALGGATDLWGTVWDRVEINADTFGVRIRKNTAVANGIDIDQVILRAYFDVGIKGEWDIDFDDADLAVRHIDGYLDYDAGFGGSVGGAPADRDVIRGETSGAVATALGVGEAAIVTSGTVIFSDIEGTFQDGEVIEALDYVDFDNEQNGGIDEEDIGSIITGATSGRTGVIVRVEAFGQTSDAAAGEKKGRIWAEFVGPVSLQFTDNEALQIGGTTRCLANGTGVNNDWFADADGTLISQVQGSLDYDGETVAFEGLSGNERIRTKNFQHNLVVHGQTSEATAMLVDDREDPNAPTTGRLYLIDINGTFQDDEVLGTLEEVDYDTEQNGGFAIGDVVSGSVAGSGTIRRLLDNGVVGTIYVETTVSFGTNDGQNLSVSATIRGVQDGNARVRVGQVVANGTLQTTNVQWLHSHLYTHVQDTFDELGELDDTVPQSAQVLDQQYTAINTWDLGFLSLRRVKSGSLKQIGILGSADDDEIFTNYQSVGSQAGAPQMYVEQSGAVLFDLDEFWDAGTINVLIRNKNKNVKISNGTVTWFARKFAFLYDHFETSAVGGVATVPLSTASDPDNQTAEATVGDTQVYHDIRFMFASHLLDFDTGSGVIAVGDVVYNLTALEAAIVCRVPASVVSGTDLHLASDGVDITGWGDGQTLDLLDAVDFDGQVSQFIVGETIQVQGSPANNAIVRFVQQFGGNRGRIWFSDQTGSFSNNDVLEITSGTNRATVNGAEVTANTWTALTNGAPPTTADITVLKDIQDGSGDQPYNVVVDLNGGTVAQLYEMAKFLNRRNAGSANDLGSILFPNNTSLQGRLYQKADSAYGAADLKKASPLGTFAGGKFFGARGIFIEDMAGADVQNFQLIDANAVTRNPPNQQTLEITGLVAGDRVAVFRLQGAGLPILTAEFTISTPTGDHNGPGDSILQVDEAIGGDVPTSGTIRVLHTTLGEVDLAYSGIDNSAAPGRFTLSAPLVDTLVVGDDAYVPLIFEEASGVTASVVLVYSSDIPILVRVRKKGILPFEQESSFISTGRSLGAVRTTDTIVE